MEGISIRVLFEGSEARLGIRKLFSLPDGKVPGRDCPVCLSTSESHAVPRNFSGGMLVISADTAKRLLTPTARDGFLGRIREHKVSCMAFAEDQEPSQDIKRFCKDNHIVLFSSAFDGPYLQSRLTGLIREKILKTVVMHGVLVNLYGLGLLITGHAGVGKTTCGLMLAEKGHIWIADDLIEVVKKHRNLYGRGYGSTGNVLALRDQGIVACRSCPGITRTASDSPLQLWCELETETETPQTHETRTIMGVSVPFAVFSSFPCPEDASTRIEKWAYRFADFKEMS